MIEPVMCVQSMDGWCVLKGELDPDACQDATLCGFFIVFRWGDDVRVPTCPDCLAVLLQRRWAEAGI